MSRAIRESSPMTRRLREIRKVAPEMESFARPWKLRRARNRFERAYVDDVMQRCGGDRERAARALGISLSSLKDKLRKGYGGR
jgi:DNA-binding NtrC family response regulator